VNLTNELYLLKYIAQKLFLETEMINYGCRETGCLNDG